MNELRLLRTYSFSLAFPDFTHMSRHSFATLALTKGIPIESVSRMLGHTKITTTQIYAKITNEKIGRDMDMFSTKLDKLTRLAL